MTFRYWIHGLAVGALISLTAGPAVAQKTYT